MYLINRSIEYPWILEFIHAFILHDCRHVTQHYFPPEMYCVVHYFSTTFGMNIFAQLHIASTRYHNVMVCKMIHVIEWYVCALIATHRGGYEDERLAEALSCREAPSGTVMWLSIDFLSPLYILISGRILSVHSFIRNITFFQYFSFFSYVLFRHWTWRKPSRFPHASASHRPITFWRGHE